MTSVLCATPAVDIVVVVFDTYTRIHTHTNIYIYIVVNVVALCWHPIFPNSQFMYAHTYVYVAINVHTATNDNFIEFPPLTILRDKQQQQPLIHAHSQASLCRATTEQKVEHSSKKHRLLVIRKSAVVESRERSERIFQYFETGTTECVSVTRAYAANCQFNVT